MKSAAMPMICRRRLNRTQAQLVSVNLYTDELVAEMMPEVTYQYWTYNGKVPGPFIRARVGIR